jgi:ribonuclease HI
MQDVIIFSDGSSRGNPGPGGWGAIVSIDGKVIELGGGSKHTTNNKMELSGAINALKEVDSKKDILLNTDSSYVINGMTKWIFGWQKNGWRNSMKEEVANRELWEELIEVSNGKKIKWNYVAGHSDIPGNERCDEIATSFADGVKVDLYDGKLSGYSIDLTKIKGGEKKTKNWSSLFIS